MRGENSTYNRDTFGHAIGIMSRQCYNDGETLAPEYRLVVPSAVDEPYLILAHSPQPTAHSQ